MPLLPGDAEHIISTNIQELRNAGHAEPQAIAMAMKTAGKSRKKGMPVAKAKMPRVGPKLPKTRPGLPNVKGPRGPKMVEDDDHDDY
jgi:hypothetical protein